MKNKIWRLLVTSLLTVTLSIILPGQLVQAAETVWLDFGPNGGTTYLYSASEKAAIMDAMTTTYAPFGVTFTLTGPTIGSVTKVEFNSTAIGTSSGVDYRNLSTADLAGVNALDGISLVSAIASSANVVQASINLATHELNHALGARHQDAYNPVGTGISGGGSSFTPLYPGPSGATSTGSSYMSLTTQLGFTASKLLDPDMFISPRTALKLQIADEPASVVNEPGSNNALPGAAVSLTQFEIPNTLPASDPDFGKILKATAITILGSIGVSMEEDYFNLGLLPPGFYTAEVMSDTLDFRLTEFDTGLEIIDVSSGFPFYYYGEDAANNDGLVATDSTIIDLLVPFTTDITLKVFSPTGAVGDYELLFYRIDAVPVPAAVWLFGSGLLGLIGVARRKRNGKGDGGIYAKSLAARASFVPVIYRTSLQ